MIAIPLLKILEAEAAGPEAGRLVFLEGPPPAPKLHPIIIDLNLLYPREGRIGAKRRVAELIGRAIRAASGDESREGINHARSGRSEQYLFCRLAAETIRRLVAMDSDPNEPGATKPFHRSIHHVWPDFRVKGLINRSISTIKADAAHRSFSALGEDIVWAVIDSGIDGNHPHFRKYDNLRLDDPIAPADFTVVGSAPPRPMQDVYGHGTHVAGIIAGGLDASKKAPILVTTRHRDERGEVRSNQDRLTAPITGMAPRCKLLSLKVLDDEGEGEASSIIAALEYIQEINGNGRHIRIHGVNLSVGYDFDPEWFACGQSPLCVEVNRMVRSGVVVVAAAGNSGYGQIAPSSPGLVREAGLGLTINDPGNADLAITVGSTHRDMPQVYGVSYFSSKGPTGDGRYKPDLVAPGENILSCRSADEAPRSAEHYQEKSGTSQATPHVSGVIAAFLSCRREFIGRPEEVKRVFLSSATDLNRTPYFQGKGLVDLMRAIQSV
ncbi:S8 family peptidase [Tundrisphaera sp. TA3]|uniref:S8 family peptidase n=1 Tax=Tundrisphaera sp. TA3 TaxID=3435775 RepID=UPI003EBAEC70